MDLRKQILIIEDDDDIALSLKYNLEKEGGYAVRTAPDGESGLRAVAQKQPDLVILDLNLPGMDGLSVCKHLRKQPGSASVPIMMLTARVEESDKIVGLELGADDYIVKPFGFRELLARIRAVTRRTDERPARRAARIGSLGIDVRARRAVIDGRELGLTPKEFDLLALLASEPGVVVDRQRILREVWDTTWYGSSKTVDVHVAALRKKLGDPTLIETVRGVGLRLRA